MSDAVNQLAREIVNVAMTEMRPAVIRLLRELAEEKRPDPLMSTAEVAKYLRIGETKVRELAKLGYLPPAPGLIELKFRKSVVDAYG